MIVTRDTFTATSIHPLLAAPAHSTHTRAPCVGGARPRRTWILKCVWRHNGWDTHTHMPRKEAITPSGSGSVIEASPEAKLRGRPLRGNAEVRGDAEPGCRVAAVAAARLAGLAAGAAACSLPACEQKKNHATHLRSSEDIGTRERGLHHATEQLVRQRRASQAHCTGAGRDCWQSARKRLERVCGHRTRAAERPVARGRGHGRGAHR